MELLVELRDKKASNIKRGDVIAIQPDGWNWGKLERGNPDWRIIHTGELAATLQNALLMPPYGESPVNAQHFRGWAIDLGQIPDSVNVNAKVIAKAAFQREVDLAWTQPVAASVPSLAGAFGAWMLTGIAFCRDGELRTAGTWMSPDPHDPMRERFRGMNRRTFVWRITAIALLMCYVFVKRLSAATVTNSIGSAGGRDYSTVQAWINALPSNLVTDGNSYVGECYNDSEFSVAGVVASFGAHTTDATHTITLTTATGQSFQDNASVRSTALKYNQTNGVALKGTATYSSAIVFSAANSYVTISKLQIQRSATGGSGVHVIDTASGNDHLLLKDCIAEQVGNASSTKYLLNSNGIGMTVVNFLGICRGTSGDGIKAGGGTTNLYLACSVVRASDKTAAGIGYIRTYATTPLMESCCSFGFSTCVSGTWSSSSKNNATDQASGLPGTSNQHSVTYNSSTPFTNAASTTQDWRSIASTSLASNGFLDSTNGPNDISKYARPGSPTIGHWQITVSSGGAITRRFIGMGR